MSLENSPQRVRARYPRSPSEGAAANAESRFAIANCQSERIRPKRDLTAPFDISSASHDLSGGDRNTEGWVSARKI